MELLWTWIKSNLITIFHTTLRTRWSGVLIACVIDEEMMHDTHHVLDHEANGLRGSIAVADALGKKCMRTKQSAATNEITYTNTHISIHIYI